MEQQVSEQYDEQQEFSEQSEGDAGLQPGQSPDPELETEYGEPDEGPEVEDDPRLDTEVTDENTDLEMGLDDTEDDGATSIDMSEAEGDEGPGAEDSALSEDVAAELADDVADESEDG